MSAAKIRAFAGGKAMVIPRSEFSTLWKKCFHTVEKIGHLAAPFAVLSRSLRLRRSAIDLAFVRRLASRTRHSAVFHAMENFFGNFPQYGKNISTLWKTALPVLMFVAVARAERTDGKRQGLTPAGIERLGMWCEFMPYAEVEGYLPALAEYDCELILHVERESFGDPDFPRLVRAAELGGGGVDAWLLLPYEEHLYVGQASVASVRNLARRAADFFEKHHLKVRAFVFDCEPSPLLGAELFAAARRGNLKKLAGIVRRELDAEAFERDTAEINALIAELRGRGYAVDGAANRAFLDAQSRGNVALEDGLNAPVSAVGWDALSFITYRYGASALDYVAMLNRYASLARRLNGERAALDVGLLGDYDGIPENAERAALLGGEEEFMAYLRGMRSVYDLEEAVGVVLGCGVRRVNLYALDGAATSVAGVENWLKAARRAVPRSGAARWTPLRSVRYGAMGALTEKLFRWWTGGSEKTHGPLAIRQPAPGAGERQP
jgi:hypothetical protein